MIVTNYRPEQTVGPKVASFSVQISEWHITINNMAVVQGKNSGWFIAMPCYKNKTSGNWTPVIEFDKSTNDAFLKATRVAVEKYANERNIQI